MLFPSLRRAAPVLLGLLAASLAHAQSAAAARMLFIPYGWAWALLGLVLLAGVSALAGFLYGRARHPGRAGRYATAAVTHVVIWLAILVTLYPVIYLVGVSFNRNNALASVPPREGSLLVRAGLLPAVDDLSLVQYARVLSETHLYPYQLWLLGAVGVAAAVMLLLTLALRAAAAGKALRRWRNRSGWLLLAGVLALMVSISPEQFYRMGSSGQRLGPTTAGMMILFVRNTLLVSTLTGLFAVAISTTAGYAFARLRFQGRYGALLSFVFVQMFPGFMAIVAIFYLMNYLGLLNTYAGLILAYSGGAIAFSSWIFKGYLESISPSLEEQAMVDGATRWGAFVRVILPLSVPMLLFIFLLQFIGTYSEFILASVLLTDNDLWTVGLGLRALASNALATQWGTLAASAVLGSLPILIIFYSFQEAFTGQYTAGGIKE